MLYNSQIEPLMRNANQLSDEHEDVDQSIGTDNQIQQTGIIPQIQDPEYVKDTIRALIYEILDYKYSTGQIPHIVQYLFAQTPEDRLKYMNWILESQDHVLKQYYGQIFSYLAKDQSPNWIMDVKQRVYISYTGEIQSVMLDSYEEKKNEAQEDLIAEYIFDQNDIQLMENILNLI